MRVKQTSATSDVFIKSTGDIRQTFYLHNSKSMVLNNLQKQANTCTSGWTQAFADTSTTARVYIQWTEWLSQISPSIFAVLSQFLFVFLVTCWRTVKHTAHLSQHLFVVQWWFPTAVIREVLPWQMPQRCLTEWNPAVASYLSAHCCSAIT